jgi:D-aminopeptidase
VRFTTFGLGLEIGDLPSGPLDAITDVEGVRVGHKTVTSPADRAVQTGVTVVLPHERNLFREKVVAASHVLNGFGKSTGLIQVDELGVLESPIALTNTLSVPTVTDGILDHLLQQNPEIGTTTGSVNVVVTECNDSLINDLRGRHVTRAHVKDALASARGGAVAEGAVGAGRGMVTYGLKGGIGTSSRVVSTGSHTYTVGILVLSNFGSLRELTIAGRRIGRALLAEDYCVTETCGDGSIITILATDAPVSDRQLRRLLRRVQNGAARTGSTTATGSGEIAVGFSTAHRIGHFSTGLLERGEFIREDGALMNDLFSAVTEATEAAILHSLLNAETVVGRAGRSFQRLPVERLADLMANA